jgi:hypothetical protein
MYEYAHSMIFDSHPIHHSISRLFVDGAAAEQLGSPSDESRVKSVRRFAAPTNLRIHHTKCTPRLIDLIACQSKNDDATPAAAAAAEGRESTG